MSDKEQRPLNRYERRKQEKQMRSLLKKLEKAKNTKNAKDLTEEEQLAVKRVFLQKVKEANAQFAEKEKDDGNDYGVSNPAEHSGSQGSD